MYTLESLLQQVSFESGFWKYISSCLTFWLATAVHPQLLVKGFMNTFEYFWLLTATFARQNMFHLEKVAFKCQKLLKEFRTQKKIYINLHRGGHFTVGTW